MRRPKILNFVLTNITGEQDYRLLRAFILKEKHRIKNGIIELIADRFITLIKVIIFPVFLRYEKKPIRQNQLIVCYKYNFDLRKKYIQNYQHTIEGEFSYLDLTPGSLIFFSSAKNLIVIMKYYIKFIFMAILLLFEPSNISTKRIADSAKLIVKFLGTVYPKRCYIFFTYTPEVYLLSLFLAKNNVPVDYMIMNISYFYHRYSNFVSDQRICFSSAAFFLEYQSYVKMGWIDSKVKETIITNNEFLISKKESNTQLEKIDIGFFSSGEWARISGIYRTANIGRIKAGEFTKNDRYKIVKDVLRKLVEIAGKSNLSLKIYLHPYEKMLLNKHGVYPDFWDLAAGKENVSIDTTDAISNIFESRIGITISSTIFFDRWNEKLITYCYESTDIKSYYIPLKYMDKYRNYGYRSADQLEEKILKELELYAKK